MTHRELAEKTYVDVCQSIVKVAGSPMPDLEIACRYRGGFDWIDSHMELEIVKGFLARVEQRQT